MRSLTLVGDRTGDEEAMRVSDQVLDFTGPIAFDLPRAPPALYSGVSLELHTPSGDGEGGLALSFRVTGRTAAGVPFELRSSEEVKLYVRGGDGVELLPDQRLLVLLRFDLRRWFTGITLAPPIAHHEGEHQSDDSDAADLFAENLAQSATLVPDPHP